MNLKKLSNNSWYEYYSALENKILSIAITLMDLEDIMLTKIKKKQKAPYVFIHIYVQRLTEINKWNRTNLKIIKQGNNDQKLKKSIN